MRTCGGENRRKQFWSCKTRNLQNNGFTLLEILVTIIISAILAVILVQVMTNLPGRSFQAINAFDKNLALKSAMENITADYRNLQRTDPAPLVSLQERLRDGDYWAEGDPIDSLSYCLGLEDEDDDSIFIESTEKKYTCTFNDTLLKISIGYELDEDSQFNGQSLTALFAF